VTDVLAASAGTVDLARLLLDLLIIIVAAKLLAELAERLQLPAVVGEIIAGVVVGPSALGLVSLGDARGVSLAMLAEIGVLILLLQVGLETDLDELRRVGGASLMVALIGVAAPFAGGAAVAAAFGMSTSSAVFLGAALTATSVGITARVFGDLRALATTEARIVLGAAVADDVLGLIVLTVVVRIVTEGSVSAGTVASTIALAIGFLLVAGALAVVGVPRLLDLIERRASSAATASIAAAALMLAFAQLADVAKLAFIIGAFMAGVGLGRSRQHERIARDLGGVGNLLIPVFFAQIGINADLGAMFTPSVLGLAAVLSMVAVLGKLVAAFGARGRRVDRWVIGFGMVPRGEVGLIFASIGLANGVLDDDQYGALLLVVLATTLLAPLLLRRRVGRSPAIELSAVAEEPDSGWLTVETGEIKLHGPPPANLTIPLALRTASLAKDARPSDELLEWLAANRTVALHWEHEHTELLLHVLRDDNAKAWRFLDVSGVLERALPEMADEMARRRADIGDLDPMGALRFPVVERVDDLANQFGFPSDHLLLAALAADVCESRSESCVVSFAERLAPDAAAQRVAALVADAHLVRAASEAAQAIDEVGVLQLATHLADTSHAREAHALAMALGPLTARQLDALDEQMRRVDAALAHPEFTSSEATTLAGARRLAAEQLVDGTGAAAAIGRLRSASSAWLLAHSPEELARQVLLVEPLPRAGVVRVAVTPEPQAGHWKIDIASRDAPGLLAHVAEVLFERGLAVKSATVVTWPDGAVLDTFVVSSPNRPAARDLAMECEQAVREPLQVTSMPGLHVHADNDALPWHTLLVVTGDDRVGALLAVCSALAACDVVVHSARIGGDDTNSINDRFTVSDRLGRKLDNERIERVRGALSGARTGRPSRRSLATLWRGEKPLVGGRRTL
jgi:Kef-type K+ transport system membrane component KefB